METLAEQIERTLSPRFRMPTAFAMLFQWMEDNGCVIVGSDGKRTGVLHPQHTLRLCTPGPGCGATFAAQDNRDLRYWFGHDRIDVLDRLRVFANTGGEGSVAALWEDDAGLTRVVHLGSGSGSIMVCTLATDPVDFLRLLAIGYDEMCWPEALMMTPQQYVEESGRDEPYEHNELFASWVEKTFGVTIPSKGDQIVRIISEMDKPNPADAFAVWVRDNSGKGLRSG